MTPTHACDLLVVGGGAGGFAAALAGARRGARTVLVEKSHTLGGNAVRCGVNCWEPGAGGTGIPFDLYRRLRRIPRPSASTPSAVTAAGTTRSANPTAFPVASN